MSRVTVISTPDDGSCGIGTYTGELLAAIPESWDVNWLYIPLRSPNPLPYITVALRGGLTSDRVIHVQHEYGIYGPKSVWSWLFFGILLLLARLRRRHVIVTFHSAWNRDTINPPLINLKRFYVTANNRLLAATADRAIFLSMNAASAFRKCVPIKNYEILPHGVPVETHNIPASTAKEAFGYDPNSILVVEPGYIRPEKGCDAFVDIALELENVLFLLAGGCQGPKTYCKLIEGSSPENVKVTGSLPGDRFHAAFNAADLVVLPYREVTQSGIFNWCVAYELPVLGSETPYFQTLEEKWGCVKTVDTEDSRVAAEAVLDLLQDDDHRRKLSAAMAKYKEAASMDSIANKHVEIYEGFY